MEINDLKRLAGEKAVALAVRPGMVLGLGTGSTAVHAVRKIGQLWQAGALPDIVAIPTSEVTAREAERFGIPLTDLQTRPQIDVTIDGADEIDPHFNLIKGLGGALLREKIVATASARMVVVADDRKIVTQLGSQAPLPVEVIPFAEGPVTLSLQTLGGQVSKRQNSEGRPFITDENNIILDCMLTPGFDPILLDRQILSLPGVVEHGLFLGLATDVVLAAAAGVRVMARP